MRRIMRREKLIKLFVSDLTGGKEMVKE